MFVAEDMYKLGSQRSAIRELFEYGKQRTAVVGAENVYDFSLGNPTVPAPDCVNETIRDLTQKLDSISLHGYTSAQGDIETRQAIADYLNKTYETAFSADNFYLTMGAAASLSVCFRALTTSPEDEFITIAPFFPEYRVFVEANGAKLVVVPPHTSDFQIDFEALEKAISAHTKGVDHQLPEQPVRSCLFERDNPETCRTSDKEIRRKRHTDLYSCGRTVSRDRIRWRGSTVCDKILCKHSGMLFLQQISVTAGRAYRLRDRSR